MHSLLTVHAHPDDESITTGGIMARYSQAGQRVMCVTCTGGEEGEIVVPELDTPDNHERLHEIRAEELRKALAHLGPIAHAWLGYRDSGMMGLPQNEAQGSLWSADFGEAAARLVAIVRRFRPQVIVGYNASAATGIPTTSGQRSWPWPLSSGRAIPAAAPSSSPTGRSRGSR